MGTKPSRAHASAGEHPFASRIFVLPLILFIQLGCYFPCTPVSPVTHPSGVLDPSSPRASR
jgi:hypothetical protein